MAAIGSDQRFPSQIRDRNYVIQPGDTLSLIAQRYGTTVTRLMQANNLRNMHRIRAGQSLEIPGLAAREPIQQETVTYRVRRGDTISTIATRARLSEEELLALNNIPNKNRIYIGPGIAADRRPVAHSPATGRRAEVKEDAVEEATALAVAPAPTGASSGVVSLATPNDYSVMEGNMVQVEAAETLGHICRVAGNSHPAIAGPERAPVRPSRGIGKRLKLDFSRVSREAFIERRVAFHHELQAAFFSDYHVVA